MQSRLCLFALHQSLRRRLFVRFEFGRPSLAAVVVSRSLFRTQSTIDALCYLFCVLNFCSRLALQFTRVASALCPHIATQCMPQNMAAPARTTNARIDRSGILSRLCPHRRFWRRVKRWERGRKAGRVCELGGDKLMDTTAAYTKSKTCTTLRATPKRA